MPSAKSQRKRSSPRRPKKQITPDRARFIVDQCPQKITGVVNIPGLQLQSPEHESELEKQAINLLIQCNDLTAISSQPERIEFQRADGSKEKYTVDLMLTRDTGELLRVEVKPLAKALSGDTMERLIAIGQHFATRKIPFDILTSDVIEQEPRNSISIRLRGFIKQNIPEAMQLAITSALESGHRTINELIGILSDDESWAHILAMVAQRQLCISWDEKFSKNMYVSLPNKPFPHLSYASLTNSSRFRPLVKELVLGRRPTDQQLLAAALAKDRSVALPDPYGAVGALPKRGMQVSRTLGLQGAGSNGDAVAQDIGKPAD